MPRLPRIAILSSFPADHTSFSGGVETATAALLEGLRDYHAEFEFHLVATSRSLPTDVHEQREGVWYHFLGGLHRPWLRPRLPLGMLKARGELSRIRPDLVHCQDNADLVLAAVLDGHRPILTIHGLSSCEVHLRTGWEYWSTRASMILGRLARRYVDVYLYNSAYVAGIVGGRQRTFTIPNAVSSTFLRWQPSPTPSKGPYLMFAGVLAPLKRPADVLAAHAELRREFRMLETFICGDVEDAGYARALRATVAAQAIEGVRFLGAVPQDQLARLLRGATALVLPSAQENVPMVIAEAMASGVPVVATRVGGIPEMVVDGKTGFLYTPGAVGELTDRLRQLLLDPPLRQRLGSEARTLAEQRYAPERVAAATVQVYRRLLSERATRHGPAGALTR